MYIYFDWYFDKKNVFRPGTLSDVNQTSHTSHTRLQMPIHSQDANQM